jgi:hypothetical protein
MVNCEESLYVVEPSCFARRWRSRAGRPLSGAIRSGCKPSDKPDDVGAHLTPRMRSLSSTSPVALDPVGNGTIARPTWIHTNGEYQSGRLSP